MSAHLALAKLRAAALALPEAEERLSHGQPTYFVAGKQFAQFRDNHHGDGVTGVCVKTSGPDEQAMLIEAEPDLYSRPAYLGPSGWISINLAPADTDWEHVRGWLVRSWELAAPKRLTETRRR